MIAETRRLASLGPFGISMLGRAFLALLRIRIALWVRPWNRLTAPAARAITVESTRPGVDRLEWAVLAASRFVPRATCLTRALALHRLLLQYGYRSSVQVGARRADGCFVAHAWVEHGTDSLLSNASDVTQYVRFFSWPPSQPDLS